ncbi:MAG: DUF3078 domain-containing protein [Bacteroidia bacterium]|jgi:hypothetical protein|nr:DUF3078 domain-containing protein [Bacteroidia bacterium]
MRTRLTTLVLCIAFFANAQTELERAKKSLEAARESLATQQALVDAAALQVAALTPPQFWEKGGFGALNFNSLGLTNWAAGGVSSNSISVHGNIHRNYKKDRVEWMNNADLAYGLIQKRDQDIRKNEDRIALISKGNYGITEKLSYSALINFRSQFAPGFDFTDETIADADRQKISRFLAPAYITTSFGFNYNFTKYFSVFLSPASGKFTVVADDSIAAKNIYIPSTLNAEGKQFYNDNYRAEFGALLNARLDKDLTKQINLVSTLNLFNNFTDVNTSNRENIDINWETMLNMKLTDFIGVSISTTIIHDNDIAVPLFDGNTPILDTEGNPATGPRTQFKRLLGIGFSFKF